MCQFWESRFGEITVTAKWLLHILIKHKICPNTKKSAFGFLHSQVTVRYRSWVNNYVLHNDTISANHDILFKIIITLLLFSLAHGSITQLKICNSHKHQPTGWCDNKNINLDMTFKTRCDHFTVHQFCQETSALRINFLNEIMLFAFEQSFECSRQLLCTLKYKMADKSRRGMSE